MATPSALADPNARYCRCKGGDFSRTTKPIRPAYTLNIQTTILGTGIGFRTFRNVREPVRV